MNYHIVYLIVLNGELRFVSKCRLDALNCQNDINTSVGKAVLDEWHIHDVEAKNIAEVRFQASYNGDFAECYCIDLSQYSKDSVITLENSIKFTYNDILTLLKRSEYYDTTIF